MPTISFPNVRLPDWVRERRVYVFVGRECWLIREPDEYGGQWFVKTVRCNKCGKCCEVEADWRLGTKEMDGKTVCQYLRKTHIVEGEDERDEYTCDGGGGTPFMCCSDNWERPAHPECVIEYGSA